MYNTFYALIFFSKLLTNKNLNNTVYGGKVKHKLTLNYFLQILDDLKYRLENTLPFQKPLVGVKHHYGINTNLLQNIMDFWKTEYNWREREKYFNKYPHFLVNIQGLDIHFIRVKPETTKDLKVLPLLVLHGWLGSVREMYELIPLLTTPRKKKDFVFEVIVVSLPGNVRSIMMILWNIR